ncbi:MAG: hypothetical protein ACEQSA_03885 [Weeksellaceae bacterium]
MADITKPSHNISHSFNILPDVSFETQGPTETVYLVLRKHPITQIWWILNAILLPVVGLYVGNTFLPQFFTPGQLLTFNLFLIIFTFSYAWINFLLWYFTVGIITNERAVDLDFYNVLYKEFTATTIKQISEITTKIGGFIGSLFNYGTVFVKTQGFEQNMEFDLVPYPSEVVRVINDLQNQT